MTLTPDPEGTDVRYTVSGDQTVVADIMEGVTVFNAQVSGRDRLGNTGLVISAIVGGVVSGLGVDLQYTNGSLLALGVGA